MKFQKQGEGQPIVLVPGLGCDGTMWSAVAERLQERFSVILPETWGCAGLQAAARGIHEVLGELKIAAAGVAGLSMGGYITFELLRHWPQDVKAAALLDTTAFPDTPEREEKRYQLLRLVKEGKFGEVLDGFASSVLSPARARSGPERDALLAMGQALGPEVFARDMAAILQRGSYEDVLRSVRVPLLFLAGELDALTPPEVARKMAAEVPGAKVEVVAGAGHMTPLEAPERVAAVLLDFFGQTLGYECPP